MSETPSIKEIGVRAYTKWLSITMTLSVVSMAGLVSTISRPDSHPVVLAFSVSWIIVLIVTGVTRDAFVKMDPKRFYFVRWERDGQVYSRVGIGAFCWLLLHSPLGWLDPWLKLRSRRSELERLLREVNFAEGTHLMGGVSTLVIAFGYAAAGHAVVGLSFAILIIPLHVYPWMLQRWNRGRILRVMRRMHALTQLARQDPFGAVGDRVADASEIAEPGAPPNGGPAEPSGDSDVGGGPPSVS
ncbi:MAG: hypothetical protein NTW03_07805 [Verrucomicrobia bacterium]|nr:hypothetical protein [Verrucomicrobiota bacterium]